MKRNMFLQEHVKELHVPEETLKKAITLIKKRKLSVLEASKKFQISSGCLHKYIKLVL